MSNQAQQDGRYYGSELSTDFQSTSETLESFFEVDSTQQNGMINGLNFLQNSDHQGTENLSRLIIAQAQQQQVDNLLVAQLLSYQNSDGGFGEFSGYQSSTIDTAFALKALFVSGHASDNTSASAISYLVAQQNQAGYFSLSDNGSSSYVTSLVSLILLNYKNIYALKNTISSANNYLISQINADGSVGELFESAIALTALSQAIADQSVFQPLINFIESTQLPDGSWKNDPYVTALAIKALSAQQTARPIQADKAGLAGLVEDGYTHDPLANVLVTVNASNGQSISTSTNAEGRFLVSNVAPGSISFDFIAPGYIPTSTTGLLVAGEVSVYNANLIPDPQSKPLVITGRILDAPSVLPLSGVDIHVQNSTYWTQTDAEGNFELTLPAGSVSIDVSLNGYITQLYSISAPSGGLNELGEIYLAPGTTSGNSVSSINGLITDSISNSPLRGVLVAISGSDDGMLYTGQDGVFQFDNISPGNIVISASLEGYLTASGSVPLLGGTQLQFNAALVKQSDPALLTLQGHVTGMDSQQPLADVRIETNSGTSAVSDGNGAFLIGGLQPGIITLTLSRNGYQTIDYSLTVQAGGLVDLATIAMSPDIPISENQPPQINSVAPTYAIAGYIYEYKSQVIDPEGDILSFGLSQYPAGMDIDTLTGVIRWLPTSSQLGEQSYTLVVSDSNGAVAEQAVTVTVENTGNPSYVITDVQTLNSLTVDGLLPQNYILGSHVKGGRSETWRARSSQGCGFRYYFTGWGASLESAAANALDFWSMGSGYGSDAIWDLGEPLSTLSVLPFIDHEPFPQEGIEYTVWGSDDPNAVFPQGWKLATLVSIYSQGWADNASVCGGGINIDDFAGLYTFGNEKFRYIRVKADNSISIFDTPEHTTYSGYGDDSGLPGWQSVESEIDGVVGMQCQSAPQANAGADILGKTGADIVFDASQSQGNIITYGWDLDGDSEIDLVGASPKHVFNAGFDRDVSLLVVDDKGCVGQDSVHVTIGLDFPKPDLVVTTVNTENVATNLQTLDVTGSIELTIANRGLAPANFPAEVTLFIDSNADNRLDSTVDTILAVQTMSSGLAKDSLLSMSVAVAGKSPFRDSQILAMVDSNQLVDEAKEDNNIASSAESCVYTPSIQGKFDFVEKWYWPGDVFGPVNVAQLTDDNADGLINSDDKPDVIFITNYNSGKGNLVALDGSTGNQIWKNINVSVTAYGSPAVGDIDNDGFIEIVITNHDRTKLYAIEHDGTLKWTTNTGPKFTGTPRDAMALADIDHDGDVEIVHGRRLYDHLGNLLWEGEQDHGGEINYGTLPIIADLDNQGDMEIIAGRTVYKSDGTVLWHRSDLPRGGGLTAIGDFNQDNNPEIVLVAGGNVFLLDNQGNTVWGPVGLPGGGMGGAPTVGDFDGDGEPEIGIAGALNYVVFETDGSIKWTSRTRDTSSHRTGSSLFDFNLDGKVEVVYADELYLRVYDGSTGAVLKQRRLGSVTTLEYPVIADIDGDGKAEILVGSNYPAYSSKRGLFAFEDINDNWAPTRAIWNQHSYHITNINDDGTIPQYEQSSWLVHNTYRLNTFADRDPTLLADITASILTVHDNGINQPASISVRIGNAGTGDLKDGIDIAFYEGDPANNGFILGKVPVSGLAKGSYRDVVLNNIQSLTGTADIYVYADYDNRLVECNEANNRIVLPVLPQTTTGQINVATDQGIYGPNNLVLLQASVTNTSGVPGEFVAGIQIEDDQGTLVKSFDRQNIGPLAGGANLTLSDNWQTELYQAGTYYLKGTLYSLNGETIYQSSSAFDIRHSINGEPLIILRTTTDKPIYDVNDTAQLYNLARNLSINQSINNTGLTLTVYNPLGIEVYRQTVDAGLLTSSAIRNFNSQYGFTQAAEGTYTVTGKISNAAGTVLATDQAQFQIQANPKKQLAGQVRVQLTSLDRGQVQGCTDTITNIGSSDLTAQPIRQLLVNYKTGLTVNQHESVIDLTSGATRLLSREIQTNGLDIGGYACIVQSLVQGQWITLANAAFTLTLPPIIINSELVQGNTGRVLILIDGDSQQYCAESNDPICSVNGVGSTRNSVQNPLGSALAPDLHGQRIYLEKLLTDNHWTYTITTDAQAFTQAFRTGTYTVYALFSEHEKLSEQVQQELREAVFRGDGLFVAGSHDLRHNQLDTALGVKIVGHHSQVSGVNLYASEFPVIDSASWSFAEKPQKIIAETAEAVGYYLDVDQEVSVTRNGYGLGRTFLAGFDLIAQASTADAAPLFDALILEGLQDVEPKQADNRFGAPASVHLNLVNQGIATSGRAVITVPDNSLILDSGTAQQDSGNQLLWPFELIENASDTLIFWVQLPNDANTLEINSLIQTGVEPDWIDYDMLNLSIQVQALPSLQELLNLPEIQDKAYKTIRMHIEQAQQAWAEQNYAKALKYAINAANQFDKLNEANADVVRIQLDQAIRAIARQL